MEGSLHIFTLSEDKWERGRERESAEEFISELRRLIARESASLAEKLAFTHEIKKSWRLMNWWQTEQITTIELMFTFSSGLNKEEVRHIEKEVQEKVKALMKQGDFNSYLVRLEFKI